MPCLFCPCLLATNSHDSVHSIQNSAGKNATVSRYHDMAPATTAHCRYHIMISAHMNHAPSRCTQYSTLKRTTPPGHGSIYIRAHLYTVPCSRSTIPPRLHARSPLQISTFDGGMAAGVPATAWSPPQALRSVGVALCLRSCVLASLSLHNQAYVRCSGLARTSAPAL